MAVINTNISSINAQNNLAKSQGELQTSLQRLSSGLRINSAKDDAAGLAISNRFTSQIRGLNQAARNANDGISVAQVAEGALQESTNILQRMRELSLQSANGSNSSTDRAALQKEFTALKDELTRIANTTSFGTTKLLDGTFSSSTFQIGAQSGETVSLEMTNAKATALGKVTGLTVTTDAGTPANIGKAAETVTFAGTNANGAFSLQVELAVGDGLNDIVDKINETAGGEGIYATLVSGVLTLQADDSLWANTNTFTTSSSIASDGGFFNTNATTQTVTGTGVTISGAISGVGIDTQSGATSSLAVIDSAITEIDSARADLGAFQNRLESTISNLRNISENVSAARSRILDADFAAETANLTRIQILQQAGTAILSQANAAPQSVLSLLQ